jgi:hypothetical protein
MASLASGAGRNNQGTKPAPSSVLPGELDVDGTNSPVLGTTTPSNTPQTCMTPSQQTRRDSSPGKGNSTPAELLNEKLTTLALGQQAQQTGGTVSLLGAKPKDSGAVVELKEMDEEVCMALADYEVERKKLEDKYEARLTALYSRRFDVLVAKKAEAPSFWRTCLLNNKLLKQSIAEKDEACLEYLTDIRTRYLPGDAGEDTKGFALDFVFSENPYFTNTTLTKTYVIPNIYESTANEPTLKFIKGCDIDWKSSKMNLTVKEVKQRKKGSSKTRTVQKPCESFFNFFDAPTMDDVEDEEDYNDRCEIFDMDMEMAMVIREKVIPHAVYHYTGEYVDSEDDEEDDDDSEFDSEDDEDYVPGAVDDDSDEDSADEDSDDEDNGGEDNGGDGPQFLPSFGVGDNANQLGPDGKPQDCKQQ